MIQNVLSSITNIQNENDKKLVELGLLKISEINKFTSIEIIPKENKWKKLGWKSCKKKKYF